MSKSTIDTTDKRIVFMVCSVILAFALFFASLTAIKEQTWEPLLITAYIAGMVIGLLVFFYLVIRALWWAAKKLFPDD